MTEVMNLTVDFLSTHRTAVLIVAGLIVLICLKPIVWWLFSFDGRVAAILHRTKSSEVRLGKIAESLAPVLDDFPVDVKKTGTTTVFLGQPIDFIHFDPDTGVTFIEVKSGDAKLTTNQRRFKDLIESGRVSWSTYRIDGNG